MFKGEEIWKPVIDCPEFYEVSNLGRVRSWAPRRRAKTKPAIPAIRALVITGTYYSVLLTIGGRPRLKRVHHMVLDAFVGPRGPGQEARHLNGNRLDNRLSNLRWGTRTENGNDMLVHGTHTIGARNGNAKLTAEQSREIYRRVHAGEEGHSLAKEFGLSDATISRIKNGL